MTRVFLLYERKLPTAAIMTKTFALMTSFYPCHIDAASIFDISADKMLTYDVVICIRGESPRMAGFVKTAKAAGLFVIFYLDDDLKDIPHSVIRFPGRKKWLLRCIGYSNVLLTPNLLIAEEYVEYTKCGRSAVMNSVVNSNEINPANQEDGRNVRIVYAASRTRIQDFIRYVQPVISDVARHVTKHIDLTFIGCSLDIDLSADNLTVYHVPSMPLEQYRQYMRAHPFDIGLAPLEDSHFGARKYFNKYLEYSSDGICGVYSSCPPYSLVIQNGVNGYLAENTEDGWKETLTHAIEHPQERQACVTTAQNDLLINFSPEKVFSKLTQDIPEILTWHVQESEKKGKKSILRYFVWQTLFRIAEMTYLLFSTLQKAGIKAVYRRCAEKFKDSN